MIFFSHPLFLTALVCVGVPVLLHFLMKPRPKKLTFPAFRFLQSHEKSCRQSLRLRQWLLLAVRMLLILTLVLLFARPAVLTVGTSPASSVSDPTAYANTPTAAIFLFDSSVRMDYVFENQNRLEAAKNMAVRLLAGLPAQSVASVVSTHLAPLAFSPDRSEIQRQIQQLETNFITRPIPEVLSETLELFKTSELSQREIFIFTDQTAASWESGGSAKRTLLESALRKFPDVRISVVSVGVSHPQNARLSLPDEKTFQTVSGGSVEIHSQLFTNDGLPHRIGFFMLDENGMPQLRGETSVEPASTAELPAAKSPTSNPASAEMAIPFTFQSGGLKTGSNQGFLALLDGDALAADNFRGFTIQKKEPTPLLLVANAPAEKNAFFVRQALAPMQFALEKRADFDCAVLSFTQFSQWLGGEQSVLEMTQNASSSPSRSIAGSTLERYHAIFFLDPPGFSASEWNRLTQYVNSGGGAAFFLGPSLKKPENFQLAEARSILPGIPRFQARFPDGTFLNPRFQTAHPILKTFQSLETQIPWDESPVFRAWSLTSPAPGTQELFTWSNDSPALLAASYGSGRVVLAGTPVQPIQEDSRALWNLLPQSNSWVFLVLMNSTANFLAGTEETSANILIHETLSFPLRGTLEDRFSMKRFPFHLPQNLPDASEKEKKKRTEDSEIVMVPDLERHQIDLPPLELTGNYRVAGSKNDFRRGFSVNLPLAATDLTMLTEKAIQDLFRPHAVTFLPNVSHLVRGASGSQSNEALFNWLGLLLLMLFFAENWISNRFYRTA